jgi:hypothetical protein
MNNVLCFENNQNAGAAGIGYWALQDQISNICATASAMSGTNASGFTGIFQVQAAALGGATDLYASSGTLRIITSAGTATMSYTGKTATTFTGCTVTAGSGTFQTGNQVVTTTAKFTTNGLQLSACHSWANTHTWAAVFDGQVSDVDCHWEGAQYGQLLIRNTTNKAGGFIYDFTGIASGCGIQLGDNGATSGVPLSAAIVANACDLRTRVSAFLNDVTSRSSLYWVSCTQSSVDLLSVTKTTGTYATTIATGSNGIDLSTFTSGSPGTVYVASTQSIPNGPGTLTIATAQGNHTATFTGTNGSNGGSQGGSGRTTGTQFTGVVAVGAPSGSTMSTGGAVSLQNIGSLVIGGTVDTSSRIRVQAASSTTALSTGASFIQQFGAQVFDIGTAANGWELRVNGTQQANFNGSNKEFQFPNGTDLRGYSDSYSTKTWEIPGATGIGSLVAVAPTGLTGATSASRYVGATASGAPASGTFSTGDFCVDLTGKIWLCTAGGTPGTWVSLAPAPALASSVSWKPADPTGTTSTTLVMMGLGATCVFTPAVTGKVLATFSGVWIAAGTAEGGNLLGKYGTGTAPLNGVGVTGTSWGAGNDSSMSIKAASGSAGIPYSFTQLLTLTARVTYWFDLATATSNSAGTAEVLNACGTFVELPS